MTKKANTKQKVNDLTSAKSKYLIELGQEVYLAYRRGESIAPIVENKANTVQELDSQIYDLLKESAGQSKKETSECSCGAPLAEDDVFCPECGRKADAVKSDEQNPIVTCDYCNNDVPADAYFCSACGVKIENVHPA